MATELKLRRGTTSQHSSFTGAEAEVTVDTDKETVVVHDGATVGGYPVAREDMSNVPNDTISGDQIAGGDATFDSINVDSGTLFVDSANNLVGVGTSSPSEKLDVNGNIIADGIYLGGTGSANYLEDYEEGTWTPVLGGATSESGQTYVFRTGNYTKIGRMVFAYFDVELSNEGTITGNASINGLPFTGDGNLKGAGTIVFHNAIDLNVVDITLAAPLSNTKMGIRYKTSAASTYTESGGNTVFANNTRINGAVYYQTA